MKSELAHIFEWIGHTLDQIGPIVSLFLTTGIFMHIHPYHATNLIVTIVYHCWVTFGQ